MRGSTPRGMHVATLATLDGRTGHRRCYMHPARRIDVEGTGNMRFDELEKRKAEHHDELQALAEDRTLSHEEKANRASAILGVMSPDEISVYARALARRTAEYMQQSETYQSTADAFDSVEFYLAIGMIVNAARASRGEPPVNFEASELTILSLIFINRWEETKRLKALYGDSFEAPDDITS